MKKAITKEFLTGTLICLATILEGVIVYNRLPETVATHFTFSGTANDYSTRAFAVFFLPLMLTALNFFIALSLQYSEKGRTKTKFYRLVYTWLCPFLAVVIQTSIILFALGINITRIMLILIIIYILILIYASIRKEDK